jgi:type IV pilus assembly protein PilO
MLTLIFIIYLDYLFYLSNELKNLKFLVDQEVNLQYAFTKKHKVASSLREYQAKLNAISQAFSAQMELVANQSEIPQLLNAIAELMIIDNLQCNTFSPLQEGKENNILNLSVQLSATGSYPNIIKWLYDVARLNRLLIVQNFVIQPSLQAGTDKHNKELRFDAKLIVYFVSGHSLDKAKKSFNLLKNKIYKNQGLLVRNFFVKPSASSDFSVNSLINFPLNNLKWVGIINHDKKYWALLLAPNEHVYAVTVGDLISQRNGKIIAISANTLKIEETSANAYKQIITLKRKE